MEPTCYYCVCFIVKMYVEPLYDFKFILLSYFFNLTDVI